MFRENTPYLSRIGNALATDPEFFQANPLTVEHPENIMIGKDEQAHRIGKRCILGKPAGIAMAVWAPQWQIANGRKEPLRYRPNIRVRGQKPIVIQEHHSFGFLCESSRHGKEKHYNVRDAAPNPSRTRGPTVSWLRGRSESVRPSSRGLTRGSFP